MLGIARRAYLATHPGARADLDPATREVAVWDPVSRVEVFRFPGDFGLLNGEDRLTAMHVPGARDDTDAINEAVWLVHRDETADEALAFSRRTHEALMDRLRKMSDADLRHSYNHYQPNDPRDSRDDRPVVEWVAGNTYEHYAEHIGWINQLVQSSS